MADKKTWEEQLSALKNEQAPESLLNRITTVVPNMAQVAPQEKQGFADMFLRFMGEWRYGLALKLAAFACVAVLGVMAGMPHADDHEMVGSLLFGDIGWESVI